MSSAVCNSSLNGGSPSNKSSNSSSNTPLQQNGNAQSTNEILNSGTTKHWSQKKHDSCISSQCIENSNFLQKIRGGSDSGQFIYLDSCLVTTNSSIPTDSSGHNQLDSSLVVKMLSGKLLPGEIILEIQGKKISGFTLYDVISWLKQLAKSYQSITLRTVKSSSFSSTALSNNPNNINISTSSNSSCSSTQSQSKLLLPYELRQYLDERFQKGSIDYDLQQVIRENVYMRTVPCTTRLPRQGEIHGQDYIFLTNDEFLEMEQNGDLLEYGVYNGHYYGTPKPPKEPKQNNLNSNNINAAQQQKNQQQLQHQQSLTDMTSMLNLKRRNSMEDNEANELNGNTEISNTTAHQLFNQNLAENSELIPYGWEKVEDPEYGTFYIDHINKQTTYENPFMQQQLLSSSMKTFKPANNASSTSNLNAHNQFSNNRQQNLEEQNEIKTTSSNSQMQLTFNSSNRRNIFFTQNPNELKGEFFKTSLLKTSHGFGFTIIGANETSEDFLQIKFVVPDGAADRDGCLRQGDVLVYVNNECVLGYTHQDVVEIFQSIPVGNSVDLTVCRGYPLSIDPNDPNIEMVPLAAINNPNSTPAPLASADELTASSMNNSQLHNHLQFNQQKLNDENGLDNEYYCEEYEEMYAAIVKGPKGFGFTIADDSQMNHQKVKQILDRDRCINLLENDILLEINGVQLRNFNHNQVVDVLKECVKGKETIIKLKRRKYSISLPGKNSVSNLIGLKNGNGESMNGYSPTTIQSNTPNSNGKANGIKHTQSPQENNGDFRPISSLAKPNGHIFNTQLSQKQLQRETNQSNPQFNVNSNSANPNQVAFNYERRSKTPNILQSSSQANNLHSNNIFYNQPMPNKQPMENGHINAQSNNQYQPQLRSKTPTTDRQLFQHSLQNTNQFDNSSNNDYIYLNSTNANQINGVNKKSQNQHNLLDTLYSTVNKSTRTPVSNDECDFVEKTTNQEAIDNNIKEHMPIYDSTTNIQHQRVQQNLHRFNHHQQQQQQIQQQQQQQFQQQPYDIGLRSKTPGPDICYFRETNTSSQAKHSASQYFNQNVNNNIPIKKNTSSINNQPNLRSKTPTADMMYYPSNNNSTLLKRGTTTNGISSNFDNIYQPFGNGHNIQNEASSYGDFNMEEINFINSQGGMSARQTQCENQVITSDVDGNSYIETTIELYRQESGFGFRIVGGEEEGSQVAVGFIVKGGSAHVDGRLMPGDEIIMIDNECVLGATHRRVVQLMTIAGLNRKVLLMIRRRILNGVSQQQLPSVSSTNSTQRFAPNNNSDRSRQLSINPLNNAQSYPYNITLFRNGSEGFGFVIISSPSKNGPTIGKIVENSPAERCKRLNVGDRILAVNSINIIHMNHIEIVKLIKESGNSITLTIGHPLSSTPQQIADPDSFIMQSNDNMINGHQSKSNLIDFSNSNPNRLSGRLQQQQFISPQQQQQTSTKAIINQNEYHVIELRKQFQGGFGFSIRGGKEFNIPLFVLKLADMGPAMLDGRLQVGDQILEINSSDAYQMTHSDAIERIKSGGNAVTLLIRRTGMPPPSITDIIAANATAAVTNAQQQQQMPINSSASLLQQQSSTANINNSDVLLQQQLRSKSPYLVHQNSYNDNSRHVQQQFKNFSSSSSIINRNY